MALSSTAKLAMSLDAPRQGYELDAEIQTLDAGSEVLGVIAVRWYWTCMQDRDGAHDPLSPLAIIK